MSLAHEKCMAATISDASQSRRNHRECHACLKPTRGASLCEQSGMLKSQWKEIVGPLSAVRYVVALSSYRFADLISESR